MLNLSNYYNTVSSTGINASGEDKLQVSNNQWSSLKEEIKYVNKNVKT